MARKNTRSGDFTGRQKEELAEKYSKEQAAAAKSLALATAAESAENLEPVDLVPRTEEVVEETVGELTVTNVQLEEKKVKFRAAETLEAVTIGYGNHYDFEEGREYFAPESVYKYLDSKGLVWH